MEPNSVLILEHTDTLSNIFALILNTRKLQNGYKIIKKSNFNDAVAIIKKEHFNTIFLDQEFVAKEGIQLLSEIHSNCSGARCILISDEAKDSSIKENIKDKLENGSLSVLHRSFKDEELISLLENKNDTETIDTDSLKGVYDEVDEYTCEAVFVDVDFTIVYANKHFKDVHGECIGQKCFKVLGHNSRQCVGCQAVTVFDQKIKKSLIRKINYGNNIQKDIKETIVPSFTGDSRIRGYILSLNDAMIEDIMPEPVHQQLARLQSLEEQNIILLALDKESRIAFADSNFAELCECEADNIIGRPITDFLHSYLVEYLVKEEKDFVSFIKTTTSRHLNIDFVQQQSKKRITLICEFRTTGDLNHCSWEVTIIARNAQKEKLLNRLIEFLEESSQQLLSGNFDMFITLDQEGQIKSINQSFQKKLECKKSDILGKDIRELVAGERDMESLEKAFTQVIALHNVYNLRIDLKHNDKIFPTLVNVRSVQDRFNNDIGFAVVLRDIEKDLMMEATLPRIERMQALGELAATTAHQINNYMDGIFKGIALLEMDTLMSTLPQETKGEFSSHINMIRERTSRLASLTRHLTNYARSQQAPVISLGDVNSVVKDVVELVKDKIKAKEAVMRTNLSQSLPFIYFSPIHLEQVILNIVMNAHDALSPKEGKILISTTLKDNWVCISIKDNGCGIPEEIRPDIFKAFKTTKPVGVGTGLGLKLAKDIISSLNGIIEVESKVNEGATFTIKLPVRKQGVKK